MAVTKHTYIMRYTVIALCIILFCMAETAHAQHGDCATALHVQTPTYTTGPVSGYGSKQEISGFPLKHPSLFPSEEHSFWYKIVIPADGLFTFNLIPEQATDDWDFVLHLLDENKSCEQLDYTKPQRSNISRANTALNGQTGLKKGATMNFVPSGPGQAFSAPLQVKKNQQVYICTNNWSASGKGHTLEIFLPEAQEKEKWVKVETETKAKSEEIIASDTKEVYAQVAVFITTKDKKTPLIADLGIQGLASKADTFLSASEYHFSVKPYEVFTINAGAKGYMFESLTVTAGKKGSKEIVKISLAPLKEGERVSLPNIQFFGNSDSFLPGSKSSLSALLQFMQVNGNAHIEIQGHVNGPGSPNTNEFRKLSNARAEAVKNYLTENGIQAARLKANGYGNTKMIYPNPVNEGQHAANRRVEIVIQKLK